MIFDRTPGFDIVHAPCDRLCCPVVGDHDRTHPRCVVAPLTWDGDQA